MVEPSATSETEQALAAVALTNDASHDDTFDNGHLISEAPPSQESTVTPPSSSSSPSPRESELDTTSNVTIDGKTNDNEAAFGHEYAAEMEAHPPIPSITIDDSPTMVNHARTVSSPPLNPSNVEIQIQSPSPPGGMERGLPEVIREEVETFGQEDTMGSDQGEDLPAVEVASQPMVEVDEGDVEERKKDSEELHLKHEEEEERQGTSSTIDPSTQDISLSDQVVDTSIPFTTDDANDSIIDITPATTLDNETSVPSSSSPPVTLATNTTVIPDDTHSEIVAISPEDGVHVEVLASSTALAQQETVQNTVGSSEPPSMQTDSDDRPATDDISDLGEEKGLEGGKVNGREEEEDEQEEDEDLEGETTTTTMTLEEATEVPTSSTPSPTPSGGVAGTSGGGGGGGGGKKKGKKGKKGKK